MAERNSRLKKHRDGLEAIINRAMEYVQEASETSSAMINQQPVPEREPSMNMHATPDLRHALDGSGRLEDCEPQIESSPGGCDLYTAGLLSDLQSFPFNLQDVPQRNGEVQPPFHGAFTEDFWATGAFDHPMLDSFGWKM